MNGRSDPAGSVRLSQLEGTGTAHTSARSDKLLRLVHINQHISPGTFVRFASLGLTAIGMFLWKKLVSVA